MVRSFGKRRGAPAPVVEYISRVPAVISSATPVVEFLAPAPALSEAPAPGVEFIAPSARTQFFSLSHQRLQMQRHTFPIVTGTKSRKGTETPTSSLSRRRLVDEAGHVLDMQVERVMRASVARLGNEWRRTKKRETVGGDFAAPQSRVAVVPKSWAYGDVTGSAGGGPWSDPCSLCDRWCGLSGGLFGAQCRVPRSGDSEAGAAGVCGGQFGGQGGGDGPVACAARAAF